MSVAWYRCRVSTDRDARLAWATDVLAACEAHYGGITPVQDVLAIARDRTQWHLAASAAQNCRIVRGVAAHPAKTRKRLLLELAEVVALLIVDPTNGDVAASLSVRARAFVEELGDPGLALDVSGLLTRAP